MSISLNIKIRFNNINQLQQMLEHQTDTNINIKPNSNFNQNSNNCINQSSSSNQSNIKKPKIKEDNSYKNGSNQPDKRLTRKNLNSCHFNDKLGYRKTMNKVESWLNDYPKSGVLYPYFDLSDEKNR